MPEPKILLWDIENSPSLGWYYDRFNRYGPVIIADEKEWFILSFAYKWLGEKKIHFRGLPDYSGYKQNPECDKKLVTDLNSLLNQADITIAHNGDRHDILKANTRFVFHGLKPPADSKSIDTFKVAKRHFKFTANNLGALATYLGLGDKYPTTGFDMHRRCIKGDLAAWREMKRYNVHDVFLLDAIFPRLRPFMKTHPNLNFYTRREACPVCQSQRISPNGWYYIRTGKRGRSSCMDCGHRFVSGEIVRER